MRKQRDRLFVRQLNKLLLCLCLLIAGCATSEKVDNRDYAFDTYYPTPNEIQLAQHRAQRYWAKNSQRLRTPTKYLAVYVTSIVQGDVNQDLYAKLINSQTTTSFFQTYSSLNASCIMIYDTATNRFVRNQGYASVDLPSRGAIAHWDGTQRSTSDGKIEADHRRSIIELEVVLDLATAAAGRCCWCEQEKISTTFKNIEFEFVCSVPYGSSLKRIPAS
jgi:hypothetical protein